MDQFYANEPMDRLNKGLFTFASYNAGPGRMQQLRKLAPKRDLDPNKWFNNVERIATEEDRPGNGDLRVEHLQVLSRVPDDYRAT
jgi:membrane-bound lytic murein transglycosylase MltF